MMRIARPSVTIAAATFAWFVFAAVATAEPGPSTQPSDAENENAALKERIASLEARVKTLERQLRDARAPGGRLRIVPEPTPPPPRAVPELPYMPNIPNLPRYAQPVPPAPREGWQEREFNGIRFYLVPLREAPQAR